MLRNILEIQTHVHFSLSPLISMSTPSCSPTHRWHLSWHKPVIMAQGTSTVWKSGTELQIPNIQHNYLSTWYAQIPYVSCSYRIAIGYLRRLEKNGNHFHSHLACHCMVCRACQQLPIDWLLTLFIMLCVQLPLYTRGISCNCFYGCVSIYTSPAWQYLSHKN